MRDAAATSPDRAAGHLRDQLHPRGVGVVIEAEHTCMSLRGARSRAEFLTLTRSKP